MQIEVLRSRVLRLRWLEQRDTIVHEEFNRRLELDSEDLIARVTQADALAFQLDF